MSVFEAVVLAVVEGLTEFLPVSSTGHMIIASSAMGIAASPFVKTFTVAIQLGAIASVIVLYWKRFFQSVSFYVKLALGAVPAAVLGLLFNDYLDRLLESVEVVAVMLILGGVVFLFLDRIFKEEADQQSTPSLISAVKIGLFQCLAMVPGVSRSAATIIGGLTQKLTRQAAAEFSFFLAVPTMLGATGLKLIKYYKAAGGFSSEEITMLSIGNAAAFVVALLSIRWLMHSIAKYGFKVFGYYRIALGVVILVLVFSGASLSIF